MEERTLLIIKPDAVSKHHIGQIIAMVEAEGFRILEMRMTRLDREQAGAFYAVHREKPFYEELLDFMTSGPIVPMALSRENGVAYLRKVVGATNSREAAEGTIRARFGATVQQNAVHASDSTENAAKEVAFFFADDGKSGE
ncbi:MAG: nucleoside-diphosphate kinase [Candidatus Latescibacterota bacterium]